MADASTSIYPLFDYSNLSIYLTESEFYTVGYLLSEGKQGSIYSVLNDPNKVIKISNISSAITSDTLLIWNIASNLKIGPHIYSSFFQSNYCFILMEKMDINLQDYLYELETKFNSTHSKKPKEIEKFIKRIMKYECIIDQIETIMKKAILEGNFFKNDNLLSNFMIKYVDNKLVVYGIDFDYSEIISSNLTKDDKKEILRMNNKLSYELQTTIEDDEEYYITFDLELFKDKTVCSYLGI